MQYPFRTLSKFDAIKGRTCGRAVRYPLMPSTVIRDCAYDAERKELTIWFVSGRIYSYANVPPVIVRGLRGAASKGRFFNVHIRDHYAYREYAESRHA